MKINLNHVLQFFPLLLLLPACTSPLRSKEGNIDRNPAIAALSSGAESEEAIRFVYFGDDQGTDILKYQNVKDGLKNLAEILDSECGIRMKYSLEKRPAVTFSKTIEFPLNEQESDTPDGPITFIYDQYDLYQEFRAKQLSKRPNEIFIIKTSQMGQISNTGAPRKVCGYANPDVQFNPQMPPQVKTNIKNTILFNSDQSGCLQDFSFVIAHEVAHLLVQDNPDHMVTDDLMNVFNAPEDNLIGTSGGKKLSRKYQCPAIERTLRDLIASEDKGNKHE